MFIVLRGTTFIIIDIVPQKHDDILTHETDVADKNSLATKMLLYLFSGFLSCLANSGGT